MIILNLLETYKRFLGVLRIFLKDLFTEYIQIKKYKLLSKLIKFYWFILITIPLHTLSLLSILLLLPFHLLVVELHENSLKFTACQMLVWMSHARSKITRL